MVYINPYPWYFDPPSHGMLTPYPRYVEPLRHGILNSLPMVCRPPTNGTSISNPLLKVFWPPTYGILTLLSMVLWPPYPWNIEPLTMVFWTPAHAISNTLSMVFWPPTHGISNPLLWYCEPLLVEMRGVNLLWGGSKYNVEKSTLWSKYHMKIHPSINIPWGSKYHMIPVISNESGKERIMITINILYLCYFAKCIFCSG